MKKIIAILSAAALGTPALAGPYVNIENNAGFTGSNFNGHVTDFHLGYESGSTQLNVSLYTENFQQPLMKSMITEQR